jgi:O-antigen ligase
MLAKAAPGRRTSSADGFDDLIFYGLLAGLAVCPFWLGSNRPIAWGFNAVWFSALTVALEIRLFATGEPRPVPIQRIMLPAIGFAITVAWILLQMSSHTPAAWHHPIWSAAGDVLGIKLAGSISVNNDLTVLALLRLLTAACVFWLALQLGRDAKRAMRALTFIGYVGAAYAAYGAISFVMFPDRLLWFTKTAYLHSVTSTFVNRNNYATYAGITLVVCLGVAISIFRRETETAGAQLGVRIGSLMRALAGKGGRFLVCIFIIAAALMLTGSRGGVAASMAGVLVLAALAGARRAVGNVPIMIAGLAAAILMSALLIFGDVISLRLAGESFDLTGGENGRPAVYRSVVQSIFDSPFLGFGYGTFIDVFPMYRGGGMDPGVVWDKAHNTYLEALQGLGIPAALVFFAAIALLIAACLKGAINRRSHATPCIAAVGASAVVLLHATVDFSLQIQAVTLTWAAILGLGVAQSYSSRPESSEINPVGL